MLLALASASSATADETCERSSLPLVPGRLRPTNVTGSSMFTDWVAHRVVEVDGPQEVDEGEIGWPPPVEVKARFAVLRGVVRSHEVSRILELVNSSAHTFDTDPDTVDGFASHEIFVEQGDEPLGAGSNRQSAAAARAGAAKLDMDPEALASRAPLRRQLKAIMDPILQRRITPYVRQRYSRACAKDERRACRPCYSLIRRYREGERMSHATHHDGHALVSVVVSLSDHGDEYEGGLYVASTRRHPRVLGMRRGDAAVHQSDLYHGVRVDRGERWSWILWYRDSQSCADHGHEWFERCAHGQPSPKQQQLVHQETKVAEAEAEAEVEEEAEEAAEEVEEDVAAMASAVSSRRARTAATRHGVAASPATASVEPVAANPVCQLLLATKMGTRHPGLDQDALSRLVLRWNRKAASAGLGAAMLKLGRAYLKTLPSPLAYSAPRAARWFRRAVNVSSEPDALYGLAQMTLDGAIAPISHPEPRTEAVALFEAAALAGHAFAMYNLGIAHLYGYGVPRRDPDLAAEWFEASGLPEGMAAVAMHRDWMGRPEEAARWRERASRLGFGTPWRKPAREATGTGGAGGVDLHSNWEKHITANEPRPPRW